MVQDCVKTREPFSKNKHFYDRFIDVYLVILHPNQYPVLVNQAIMLNHSSKDFPGEKIRVAIADDHILFRAGVKTALSMQPDVKIIAEADKLNEFVSNKKTG